MIITADPIHTTGQPASRELMDFGEYPLLYFMAQPRLRYIGGHFSCSEAACRQYGNEWQFISILREPVDKWFSFYFHNHFNSSSVARGEPGVGEYLEIEEAKLVGCDYARKLTRRISTNYLHRQHAIDQVVENLRKSELVGLLEQLNVFSARCADDLVKSDECAPMPTCPELNYLLIGAQKSGTSWLATMLAQHPEVFRTEDKELHFFNLRDNYERGLEWYQQHFSDPKSAKAVGECTPNYLWVCDAPDSVQDQRRRVGRKPIDFVNYGNVIRGIPESIHKHFPECKFLVILRNPVDRAISSFKHSIRARRISPRSNIVNVGGQQGILGMGFYYRHLLRWMKVFPRERFLVLVYEEDVKENKSDTLRKVFGHLGVDEFFTPPDQDRRVNAGDNGLYLHMNYYAPRATRAALRVVPQLRMLDVPWVDVPDPDRAELEELYVDENKRLEDLLGRSLACWKNS